MHLSLLAVTFAFQGALRDVAHAPRASQPQRRQKPGSALGPVKTVNGYVIPSRTLTPYALLNVR